MDDRQGQINIEIARVLGMDNVEQTRRMASAIVANAMVFHERIVGMHSGADIRPLATITRSVDTSPQTLLLESWDRILEINYYPIFDIAKRIIEHLPANYAARVIGVLSESANYINSTGIDNAHDLTGRVFQRLIADRKYLATFYTRPASAALLAQLAVAKLQDVDWSDAEAIAKLRIADFACGTGALLSAVYAEIARRHARAGGDPRNLHKAMMEQVLTGLDVMPSAVHITAATLAGIEPDEPYESSKLYVMPYGRQPDGEVALGSLELLQLDSAATLTRSEGAATRVSATTPEMAEVVIPDESQDLIIMNPPFTRAGSDWDGPGRSEDSVKPFRGLSTSADTQKEMATRLTKLTRGTVYHGYAGIASSFVALAERKLRSAGVVAFVLPLTATAGVSWQSFRGLIANSFSSVHVVSLSSPEDSAAFSADTGMAECLIIARKTDARSETNKADFPVLANRPADLLHSKIVSKCINGNSDSREVEAGPFGATPLMISADRVGGQMRMSLEQDGHVWGAVRIADGAVAQTAAAIAESLLWLPGQSSGKRLPTVRLSEIGTRGWHHMNIAGTPGPFAKAPHNENSVFPAIWSHDAKEETRIVCKPDTELLVKAGMEERAAAAWETASHAHLSQMFRFTSQPLSVAYTDKKTLGGSGWPNVSLGSATIEKTYSLWSNSTLGMLCYWWHANRQQSGRGVMPVSAMDSLPILDFRTLTDEQLETAERIFEEFRDKELMPAYLADADPNRDLLDRRVIMDLLGFDEEVYRGVRRLAQKWCAEPSVHGGMARPRGLRPILGD